MAVVREFYRRDRDGEIESYALARDVLTDRVFVLRSSGRERPDLAHDEVKIAIGDFLQQTGPEQTALLDLIGLLVVEE